MDKKLEPTARILKDLREAFTPHPGQIRVGKALFGEDKRKIFVGCGRKWGKTEIIIYILYRWALMRPSSSCYYFAPFQKQAREIIWANKRIQNFLPQYIAEQNKTEMRITLNNGSFIKLDGSDNYESHRGTEPHLCVYEEFKDFRPEFHQAMEPNLSVYNSPLVIIGTPPDRDCQYTDLLRSWQRGGDAFIINEPSSNNPHTDKEWLTNKKQELIDRGEWDVWAREYEAKFVKGGANKIFPMLKESMVIPHDKMWAKLERHRKRKIKYIFADPAGASTFAVLFAFIDRYTKDIYLLDEIYESRQSHMTVQNIGSQIFQKRDEFWTPKDDDDWHYGYDEAATWFANEIRDHFDINFMPSHKAAKSKEDGLSLIKDIMLAGKLHISDRCHKTFWELDNYMKDAKTGKIPKENDHNIDNLRYILSAEMYDLVKQPEPIPESKNEDFRGAKISDDFPMLDSYGNMRDDIDSFWTE